MEMNSTAQMITVETATPNDAEAATNPRTLEKRLSRIIFIASLTTATGGWIAFLAWVFLKIA
jgi:hypothetical protein